MHDGGDPIADPASAETPAAPRTRRITVLVGLDAGVRAAVAFVVGLVVARSLGPEALGTLALAIAVVTLTGVIYLLREGYVAGWLAG